MNSTGNCFFDSCSILLAQDEGLQVSPQVIREETNKFIFDHSNRYIACNEEDLRSMNVSDVFPPMNKDTIAEFKKKGWIITVKHQGCPTEEFTDIGLLNCYNRPSVYATILHLITVSIMLGCPIKVYTPKFGGYTVKHFNKELPGKTKYIHFVGSHYQPIVEAPGQPQIG